MKPADPLIQLIIETLRHRPKKLSLRQIERDTGLNRMWLSLLARGQITEPGFTKLTKLAKYLNNL